MRLRQRKAQTDAKPPEPVSGAAGATRRSRLAATAPVTPPKAPRTITVGTGSLVSILVLLGLVTAWSVSASLLLVFGDRMSERLIAQQSEMQDAYEQRLQAYRAEVARLTLEIEQSKFDQTSVEGRVIEMGRRQRLIEARLGALKRLSELLGGGAPSGPAPLAPTAAPTTPITLFDAELPAPRRLDLDGEDQPARIETAQFLETPRLDPRGEMASPEVERFLERLDRALVNAEASEMAMLDGMRRGFGSQVDRIRSGFDLIGMTAEQAIVLRGRGGQHIPSVVLAVSDEGSTFGKAVAALQRDFAVLHGFRPIVATLPLFKPTVVARYASPFGYRIHPISGVRKLHAGLDMAAQIGTPVKAAGSGVVQSAGWGGGYGNLVIIDHGGGVVTRYAHLSEILVTNNQPIAQGTLLGKVGSTGASTGPHLHFETRISGSPVNPACFMLAGNQIFGAQPVPYACDQRPSWRRAAQEEDESDDG